MAEITGRSAFLSLLEQEGVTHLFGNPGTTELPIMDALAEHPGIRYVLGLQESVVVTMAEGFARATGRLTVANVHVAPGLGNAMGSLYGAKRSRVPLIVTAGQQEQGLGVTEPLLWDDLVPMAAPLVKWATEIGRIEDMARVVHRAAKIALTPPEGPVFLSLPGDVLNATADLDLGHPTRLDTSAVPGPETLERLARRLLEAAAPLILAGHEVGPSDALAELAEVAELVGARVYTGATSHTVAFPSEHPLFLGELTRNQPVMRRALEQADLVFAAGADVFALSVPHAQDPMPEGMPLIQMGLHDWEMGKNYPAEMALRAHLKPGLAALAETLRRLRTEAQARAVAERSAEIARANWSAERERRRSGLGELAGATPIEPEFLMARITEAMPAGGVIVDEGLTSGRSLQNHWAFTDPKCYFGLCGGGIGWGLPGAVGVQLGLPDRPVVCVSGDGSAMYTVQALWSAAHEKLPITYVICNNGSYRILKERLFAFAGEAVAREAFIGMDLDRPPLDWVRLGESMGVKATAVIEPEQLDAALAEAIAHTDGPTLLDVHVARGFRP